LLIGKAIWIHLKSKSHKLSKLMKILSITIPISLAIIAISCSSGHAPSEDQTEDQKLKDTLTNPNVRIEEQSIQNLIPIKSDIYFDSAIVLFKKNNFEDASMEIKRGARAILKETEGIMSIGNVATKETVDYINKLAMQVEEKEIKSVDMLSDAFQAAEYNTAHDYFQVTNIYVSNDNADSANIAMETAISHLDASLKFGSMATLSERQKLIEKSKSLLSHFKNDDKKISMDFKNEFHKFITDLKRLDYKMEGPVPL
jgi:hypothetical protein